MRSRWRSVVAPRPPRAATSVVALAVLALGCADPEDATVRLEVVFPSTAMAIASEEVRFVAYEDPSPGACQRIYLKHITNQTDLPPVLAAPRPARVCDVAFGKVEPLRLPLGRHPILAVASRGGEDLLVGCSDVAVSAEGGDAVVTLALPGAMPVPPASACASLREACAGSCR